MQLRRIACLVAAASLALAACETSGSAAPGDYAPGTYVGTAMGLGGPVAVRVTVDGSTILDVTIEGEQETAAIGGEAMKLLREGIIASKGERVDVVSGATVTSQAVKEALDAALAEARGHKATGIVADGKYVTKAMGHEGYLYVATVFRGGAIDSCRVVTHEETMGIGNYAVSRIPGRIVAAQSLAVDAVAGATISSSAIKSAVAQAVRMAGGDPAAFHKAQDRPVVQETLVERRVDVVIAGAGTAGLMAGARLVELGKRVIIFEKQDIPGGSMPMTYGGVLSSHTKSGAAFGAGREKGDIYWDRDALLTVLKGFVNPRFDRFDKRMPYKTASLDASGPMVDWLRDIGVGFEPMGKYEGGLQLGIEPYFAPGCYQGGAGYAALFLEDRIRVKGGEIVYATPAVALEKDASGRVTGLRAEGKDGKTWKVSADAVILATGGFAKNKGMLERYYPAYKDFPFNAAEGNTGDGIRMGLEAGGVVECMDRALGAFPAAYGSNYELAFLPITVPGVMVNGQGAKIPSSSHAGMGAAKLDPANGGRLFYVFDDEGAEAVRKSMVYGFSYASVYDRGEAVRYASVKEAASALGLPELASTIQSNNEAALAKKARAQYLETRDGVWAIRIDPSFYLTTGGLAIDTSARVLDAVGKPIQGLYAAGDVAGSIEEKDGLTYGYGFDSASTFGYIAARTIVEGR